MEMGLDEERKVSETSIQTRTMKNEIEHEPRTTGDRMNHQWVISTSASPNMLVFLISNPFVGETPSSTPSLGT